jgi:exodeoxyribonuclease VII small subunit
MTEDRHTFDQARARLEDIVAQVRKKDTPLETSLDLLEEGVRLANLCTEQIDHTQWREAAGEGGDGSDGGDGTETTVESSDGREHDSGTDAGSDDDPEDGPGPDGETEDETTDEA